MEEVDCQADASAEGLVNIQRLMKTISPKLAELKIAAAADSRWVRKLEESGFIDRTYVAAGVK